MTLATVPIRFVSDDPRSVGKSVRLEVAGQEIARHVRAFSFRAEAAQLATAEIEVYALDGADFTFPAVVSVSVVAYPGHIVVQEPQPDGSTRWRVEREEREL